MAKVFSLQSVPKDRSLRRVLFLSERFLLLQSVPKDRSLRQGLKMAIRELVMLQSVPKDRSLRRFRKQDYGRPAKLQSVPKDRSLRLWKQELLLCQRSASIGPKGPVSETEGMKVCRGRGRLQSVPKDRSLRPLFFQVVLTSSFQRTYDTWLLHRQTQSLLYQRQIHF